MKYAKLKRHRRKAAVSAICCVFDELMALRSKRTGNAAGAGSVEWINSGGDPAGNLTRVYEQPQCTNGSRGSKGNVPSDPHSPCRQEKACPSHPPQNAEICHQTPSQDRTRALSRHVSPAMRRLWMKNLLFIPETESITLASSPSNRVHLLI